jgi:hypothetical protein
MSVGFALLLFAGAAMNENLAASTTKPVEAQIAPDAYTSYTQAYRAAQKAKRPMLVILNPARSSQTSLISLEDVEKTRARRELLQNYVVAVIDTSTPHGQKVYSLFGSPQLPHVSVIDNAQSFQVYQTSEAMYGQLWDYVLTTFQNASPATVQAPVQQQNYCPYCQQHQYQQ